MHRVAKCLLIVRSAFFSELTTCSLTDYPLTDQSSNCSQPMPFQHDIRLRDEHAVTLIRSTLEEHPFDSSDAELLIRLYI